MDCPSDLILALTGHAPARGMHHLGALGGLHLHGALGGMHHHGPLGGMHHHESLQEDIG